MGSKGLRGVYLHVREGHVDDEGLPMGLPVLQPGVDHLVASDLPVLLHRQGGFPGGSEGGGVQSVHLQLPGRGAGHWDKHEGGTALVIFYYLTERLLTTAVLDGPGVHWFVSHLFSQTKPTNHGYGCVH